MPTTENINNASNTALLQKQMTFVGSHIPKNEDTDAFEGVNICNTIKYKVSWNDMNNYPKKSYFSNHENPKIFVFIQCL